MESTNTLNKAPRFVDFVDQLRHAEDPSVRHPVVACDLELNQQGLLLVKSKTLEGQFSVSDEAIGDLARLAKIPEQYFFDCEPDLQALSFNCRLRRRIPAEEPLPEAEATL